MKQLITIITLAFTISANAQNMLYNSGTILYVGSNVTVQVNGNAQMENGSTLTNNGQIKITGNVVNNQTMSAANAGTLSFTGNAAQIVSGSSVYVAKNVIVNNNNGITLNAPLKIDGECNFISGVLTNAAAGNAVTFTTNASINTTNAAKDGSHINGYVVKEGGGSFTYPVGDGARYQKIDVNLTANTGGMRVKYNAADAGAGTYTTTGTEATALTSYNVNEYWDVTPLSSATGTVTIYWDGYKDYYTSPAVNQRRVAHKTAGNWLNEGTAGIGSTANGSVTSNAVSTWSPFALGAVLQALPLTLTNFGGTRTNDVNILYWQTQNEVNTKHFIVERSDNTSSFTAIATIAAKGSGANTYSYDDAVKQNGKLFYRLKMVDNDGRFTYSGIVALTAYNSGSVTVSPNPVANFTTITVASNLINTKAILTDVTGKALQQITLTHTATGINLNAYPAGMYLLKLQNGQVVKLIKE